VTPAASSLEVSTEIGANRAFASAVGWPGWCRGGRDEVSAIETLLAYGPRYARVFRGTRLGFVQPGRSVSVRVLERLQGSATTDFGAPDVATSLDAAPMDEVDVRRSASILRACWRALDAAAEGARGVRLRTGPRGGGRSLDAIVEHVVGAEEAYLRLLSWRLDAAEAGDGERVRRAVLKAISATVAHGVTPSPRGGKRWTPRYFVRRVAWHALDHAWEIEDRARSGTE
jgi:hypothetical protein